MAKFFVGCRVRVINAGYRPLIGLEGRITGEGSYGEICDYWIIDLSPNAGTDWRCLKEDASSHLVPIIPDGHRASDESFHDLMDRLRAGELVGEPA